MQNKFNDISIIIPVYSCVECLQELYSRIYDTLYPKNITFEVIFVNDDSPDDSSLILTEMIKNNSFITNITLSKNFGQHSAIHAGLSNAESEWIVIMDCDLQDLPEEIIALYDKALKGFDIVFALRNNRQDSWLKKAASKLFYKTLSYLTDTYQDERTANFGIYNKKVITAFLSMKEQLRYFPVMIRWLGFNSTSINVTHAKRTQGKSSYSLGKMFSLAIDVMISFSDKPLKIVTAIGLSISTTSFFYVLYLFGRAIIYDQAIPGWTSVMVSIWFFSGLIILILGIVGIYVGKTFDETKKRPIYVIKELMKSNNKTNISSL